MQPARLNYYEINVRQFNMHCTLPPREHRQFWEADIVADTKANLPECCGTTIPFMSCCPS
jgi:hypothetical protein